MDWGSRKKSFIASIMPFIYVCDSTESLLNNNFDHEVYNVKPKNRVLSSHPTINDFLPGYILSGRIIIKKDIDRLEKEGVVFVGDHKVTEVDAIILATGHIIKFPFLGDIVPVEDNKVDLYKFIIPPKHPTMSLIGLIQSVGGPFYPIGEMQSRWFCQIVLGNLELPTERAMQKEVIKRRNENCKRYTNTTRHTVQIDWILYMDELSSEISAKPNLLKMAALDAKLFLACFNGPCLPYQFRLQGPHSWPGARSAILKYEERIFSCLNSGGKTISQNEENVLNKLYLLAFIVANIAFWISCLL